MQFISPVTTSISMKVKHLTLNNWSGTFSPSTGIKACLSGLHSKEQKHLNECLYCI
jgi:hypothetical protein